MKYLKYYGNAVGVICLSVGIFVCLCETDDPRWFEFLLCGVGLTILGAICIALVHNPKQFIKSLEGSMVFIAYCIVKLFNSVKEKCKILKKEYKFVKYFRKKGYTWKMIYKTIKKSKRKYKNFEIYLDVLVLQNRCDTIVDEIGKVQK